GRPRLRAAPAGPHVRGDRHRRLEPGARAHPGRAGARVRIARRPSRGRPRAARRSRGRAVIVAPRCALLAMAAAPAPTPALAHPRTPAPAPGRRPVPDYGRAPESRDPAEALLWIPRVIFAPVHLVLEYLVRLPLGWLLRAVELER